MIEAKELRIGNYVYKQSGKLVVNRDSIYKVETVNTQSARKYEPIPLTEDWLLKFGFEKTSDYWFNKGENELEWYSGLKVFVYRLKYSVNRSFPVREIKYVHQLQNLYFALTDEELKL